MALESGESIYALIPEPIVVPDKPTMHKSMHPGPVDPRNFELGCGHRTRGTFGPPNGESKPDSTTFMRKHAGEPVLPDPKRPSNLKLKLKDEVPTRGDKPVMGLVSSKNFITANAVENILSTPKKRVQDAPLATQKADYGETPKYLTSIKKKIASEKAYIEEQTRAAEQAAMAGSMRKMGEAERDQLVTELKLKWQRVNEAYQKLPFTLDTPMRRMRKEKYEAELTQLEKDIDTLSRKTVLVAS